MTDDNSRSIFFFDLMSVKFDNLGSVCSFKTYTFMLRCFLGHHHALMYLGNASIIAVNLGEVPQLMLGLQTVTVYLWQYVYYRIGIQYNLHFVQDITSS